MNVCIVWGATSTYMQRPEEDVTLLYPLEAGSVTEPEARLAAYKLQSASCLYLP